MKIIKFPKEEGSIIEISYNESTKSLTVSYLDTITKWVNVPAEIFNTINEASKSSNEVSVLLYSLLTDYDKRTLEKNKPHLISSVSTGYYEKIKKDVVDKANKVETDWKNRKINQPSEVKIRGVKYAQNQSIEYSLKGGNRLIVEAKYSTNVAEVSYTDKALLITFRSGTFPYTYKDTPTVLKNLFNKFVDHYVKIKTDATNRDKYSLGKLANVLNKKYPKPKK